VTINKELSPEDVPVESKTLSKKQRLIQASLFGEAFAQKNNLVGRCMVLWIRTGPDAALRLGMVTSRKVSKRAVDRNLARRRLREIFRQHRAELSGPFDLVIVARRNLLFASHQEVEAEFMKLAEKAGLLKREPQTRDEVGRGRDDVPATTEESGNTEQGMSNAEGN
jgi:ribonuclease P protein component